MPTPHSPLPTHHLAIAATLNLAEAGARSWDVIVVGAAPAGSLAARQSARHGASVLLVDLACFLRVKFCGACLNLQALYTLVAVGLGGVVERCGSVALAALKLAAVGAQ